MPVYGVDFGTGDTLAIFGPTGLLTKRSLKLPRVKGGRTPAMEFPMVLEALMKGGDGFPAGDPVIESPTIGSSGCEPQDVLDVLARYPERKLFTLSAHAVKNYRRDNGLGWEKGARYVRDGDPAPQLVLIDCQESVHAVDAEILYRIATERPDRLYRWTKPCVGPTRIHRSVRPMDKRLYRDERALAYMAKLPPFAALPLELQNVIGNSTTLDKSTDYSRSMVMPFAMVTEEPFLDEGPVNQRRRRYEKLLGLSDRGYPSFYRKACDVWLEVVSKQIAGVSRRSEVTREQRKEAQRITQRQIRLFFYLTMQHQGR